MQRDQKLFNFLENVHINRKIKFQNFIGFGNAFTGSVSYNLNKLKPELQTHIYNSHYSREIGNGFTMMRYTIGGCDFDLEPWAYNELPTNDGDLTNFTALDQRDLEKIRQIQNLIATSKNNDIKFIGSAWSPPPWMKTNNNWTGFSSLKDEYYQTWANYHRKFLKFMQNAGLNFWAITTGNEPLNGVSAFLFIRFMSLGWTPGSQGKWVAENLGPSIKDSDDFKDIKILAGDDQRYVFPWWFKSLYNNHPQCLNYIDGHAFHWYWNKIAPSTLLDTSYVDYPNKFLISTEACSGDKPWEEHKPLLGSWSRCEDYILDIIEDFNHYVSAWVDWNLVLDENGGPNYVKNYVDAPIIANVTTGDEIYKQPIFYAMGHFSRFILPESVRVSSKSSSNSVRSTAFLRPDGFVVVILYNRANVAVDVSIVDSISGTLYLNIPPKSIHSIIFK
jgi:glucosylceramidase